MTFKTIKELEAEIKKKRKEAEKDHDEVCKELGKDFPYTKDNYEDDRVNWEVEEAIIQDREKVVDLIKKHIKTNLQGIPLPECPILFKIIKEIEGE